MEDLRIVEFTSLPKDMDNAKFINAMLGLQFMIYHDFTGNKTFLILEDKNADRLESAIHGIQIRDRTSDLKCFESAIYLVGYRSLQDKDEEDSQIFKELYELFGRSRSRLIISFTPSTKEHVLETKEQVERLASEKSVRLTRNFGSKDAVSSSSDSFQTELFYKSDERQIFLSLLSMLNETYLNNGTSYKVALIAEAEDARLIGYIKSKILIFEERRIKVRTITELYRFVGRVDAIPFSYDAAADFVSFSNSITKESIVDTKYSENPDGITIGKHLNGVIIDNTEPVKIDPITFNLGTVISGLPGTGKTAIAMGIVEKIRQTAKTRTVIISPTREWSGLGTATGMKIIRLYDESTRINFFKSDSKINIERFYENLAMLLASASNAGPYKNSLEKSLLAAFRRVYSVTSCPDPVMVYDEIENSVIEQHGRRTLTDVIYTKHGENVMAALESLRLMLLKPQFAYKEGINFSELLDCGVVFDLSGISNNMKPFFYALILNQVYSFADSFDEMGNDSLRILICLEEAQLVFENDDQSAATLDLKQRIQDFRKKGIGLMIITHNITDINVAIRRLCQLKLYFRQSSDVAPYACSDMAFEEEEIAAVTDRLKGLPQGVLALSYIAIENGLRSPRRPIFVKADSYMEHNILDPGKSNRSTVNPIDVTKIFIVDNEGLPKANAAVELVYVGEIVYRGNTDKNGKVEASGTMLDKQYKLRIMGKKKRETRSYDISGGRDNTVISII